MSSRRLLCIIVGIALTSASVFAEGYPKGNIYVDGSIHYEGRDYVGDAVNFDVVAGYDFLIWDWFDLYAGPRVGLFTETVATAFMGPGLDVYWPLTAGGQIYFLYPSFFTKDLVVTCGVAADMLIYTDALHWSDGQPAFLFTEVFLGIRYYIANVVNIEARIDGGIMPFFSSIPFFIKFGLQVGYVM
jgi:hypothetical protein